MGYSLDQLNAEARQHCERCPQANAVKEGCVVCAGRLVSFANGTCPLNHWDHSQPIKHDPAPWPLMARIVARFRGPGEVGIGDTIKTQLGIGGEWFQAAYKALVGKSCGCSDRQKWLNERYRY